MDNRELDALVAEKVMDYRKDRAGNLLPPNFLGTPWQALVNSGAPPFSTDIAAAWQVIERWDEQGWDWEITTGKNNIHVWVLTDNERVFAHRGIAPEAPLAICLAALKACGVELEAGEGEG